MKGKVDEWKDQLIIRPVNAEISQHGLKKYLTSTPRNIIPNETFSNLDKSLTLALLPLNCPFFLRNERLYNGIQVWCFFCKFKTPIHFKTMHYCNNFGKSCNVSISVNAYSLTPPPPGVKFLVVISDRCQYLRNCAHTPPLTQHQPQLVIS